MATGAHAAQSLVEGDLVTHRLDDAVGAQAVGHFLDARDAFFTALFDNVSCTELAGQCLSIRVP